MKKVRFECPVKTSDMLHNLSDSECHFPRPFIENQIKTKTIPPLNDNIRVVSDSYNSFQRFEGSNSFPYPIASKTHLSELSEIDEKWAPCNELDLSILDCSNPQPKSSQKIHCDKMIHGRKPLSEKSSSRCSDNCENGINLQIPPNILQRNDDFFLRRENFTNSKKKDGLHTHLNNLTLDKENNPLLKKKEIMNTGIQNSTPIVYNDKHVHFKSFPYNKIDDCNCMNYTLKSCINKPFRANEKCFNGPLHVQRPCFSVDKVPQCCSFCKCSTVEVGHLTPHHFHNTLPYPPTQNAVDQKTLAMEKYIKTNECLDIEKNAQSDNEPTISDLFKIIKLQNQQLKMLQEKMDNFISNKQVPQPIQNFITEQVLDSVSTEQKISIGVMTSFEVVRTSTIINKEIVKQNEAQIQCNRSQVSIKEVVSKTQPSNLNFLDGLTPGHGKDKQLIDCDKSACDNRDVTKNTDLQEEKTLNDFSLYNIQVDNATTPLMSPEQSMYLDVRDFSDSDSGDDHSNVGWTYYNKVMTHVNGMLQESDMPSSASALYRNTRQKCLQMQIDKTNISAAKRVTFGDEHLGFQQHHLNIASTDTSLKMNQLAAKYLKNRPVMQYNTPSPKPNVPVEMSLATKNYMEKHRLLQGMQFTRPPAPDIPKFLDITALKQQPKLL